MQKQEKEKCHAKSMMSNEANERLKIYTQHVSLRQNTEENVRDAFDIIKPTTPFKLAKHEARRKWNWSDSSDNSLVKADGSWWECKNNRRINSSYKRPVVSTVICPRPVRKLVHRV